MGALPLRHIHASDINDNACHMLPLLPGLSQGTHGLILPRVRLPGQWRYRGTPSRHYRVPDLDVWTDGLDNHQTPTRGHCCALLAWQVRKWDLWTGQKELKEKEKKKKKNITDGTRSGHSGKVHGTGQLDRSNMLTTYTATLEQAGRCAPRTHTS